jgi:hypothetical protein
MSAVHSWAGQTWEWDWDAVVDLRALNQGSQNYTIISTRSIESSLGVSGLAAGRRAAQSSFGGWWSEQGWSARIA